uniref:Uncharacterized protein n=1 Tax=Desertifilum tharense IPPAS B-1220 TaxID=1781255 RepID=A0ACD5GPN6_9CYAN
MSAECKVLSAEWGRGELEERSAKFRVPSSEWEEEDGGKECKVPSSEFRVGRRGWGVGGWEDGGKEGELAISTRNTATRRASYGTRELGVRSWGLGKKRMGGLGDGR